MMLPEPCAQLGGGVLDVGERTAHVDRDGLIEAGQWHQPVLPTRRREPSNALLPGIALASVCPDRRMRKLEFLLFRLRFGRFAAGGAGPAYWVFRALIRTLAVGPDEAGFWPVISNPSVTTWTPQFLTLE